MENMYTITRIIEYLNHASGAPLFDQICAVCLLERDLREILDENKINKNPNIEKIAKEIRTISLCMEKTQNVSEVNKYLFECIISRLNDMQQELDNLCSES